MHIDQAIKILELAKANGTRNIVLAFWASDIFELKEGEEWANIAEHIESKMDWSRVHDDMTDMIIEYTS
jgi:hypothetical protein